MRIFADNFPIPFIRNVPRNLIPVKQVVLFWSAEGKACVLGLPTGWWPYYSWGRVQEAARDLLDKGGA